jgi:hypothetical protein
VERDASRGSKDEVAFVDARTAEGREMRGKHITIIIFASRLELRPAEPKASSGSRILTPRLDSHKTITKVEEPEIEKVVS